MKGMKISFKVVGKFVKCTTKEGADGKKYINIDLTDANTGDFFQFSGNEALANELNDESKYPEGCKCEFACTIERNYSELKKTWYTFFRCIDVTRL